MTDFKPGIYHDMPDDEYHAIPALSASGIKQLMISPLDYWYSVPWLNPDYEPNDKAHLVKGSAWHCYVCEGPEAFHDRYALELDPAEYPQAIRTSDEMKAVLRDAGEKVSGSKPVLRERLLRTSPGVILWDDLKAEHEAANEGKTFIDRATYDDVVKSAHIIRAHPVLKKCFEGGHAEVTCLWHDEEFDIPCKARFDYLKPRAIIDLKTFANPLGKPLMKAVTGAIASFRYHVQAAWYLRAPLKGEREFMFLFQGTGTPNVVPLVFPKTGAWEVANVQIRDAVATYRECMDTFGPDPWLVVPDVMTIQDDDIPPWAFE